MELDHDLYHDILRGVALTYVRLQRGREQVKELEKLRGQVSRLTEEILVVVRERDQAITEPSWSKLGRKLPVPKSTV